MCVCGGGAVLGSKKNAIKRKHNFQLESDIISGDKQSLSLLFFFWLKKKMPSELQLKLEEIHTVML